jgi:hypothetical protein
VTAQQTKEFRFSILTLMRGGMLGKFWWRGCGLMWVVRGWGRRAGGGAGCGEAHAARFIRQGLGSLCITYFITISAYNSLAIIF